MLNTPLWAVHVADHGTVYVTAFTMDGARDNVFSWLGDVIVVAINLISVN